MIRNFFLWIWIGPKNWCNSSKKITYSFVYSYFLWVLEIGHLSDIQHNIITSFDVTYKKNSSFINILCQVSVVWLRNFVSCQPTEIFFSFPLISPFLFSWFHSLATCFSFIRKTHFYKNMIYKNVRLSNGQKLRTG